MKQINIKRRLKLAFIAALLLTVTNGVKAITKSDGKPDRATMAQLEILSSNELQDVIASGINCILFPGIDPEADRQTEQNLIDVMGEYNGEIHFYKMDLTGAEGVEIRSQLPKISSIVIFKEGKERAGIIGSTTTSTIKKIINKCRNMQD